MELRMEQLKLEKEDSSPVFCAMAQYEGLAHGAGDFANPTPFQLKNLAKMLGLRRSSSMVLKCKLRMAH
ncbi:hypothetical protein L195_g012008 [Trifolium pratense]|uniref:Uncharacterized protein n=1 Tax=Trifolium pratense TaxID=57577 RepID=A0A2K3PJ74_TRIPR|nr:hypothetical protein L195_g012008 [Trifolium pratense]